MCFTVKKCEVFYSNCSTFQDALASWIIDMQLGGYLQYAI